MRSLRAAGLRAVFPLPLVITLLMTSASAYAQAPLSIIDFGTNQGGEEFTVNGSLTEGGSSESRPSWDGDKAMDNDTDYYLALLNGPEGPCIGWTTNPGGSLSTASAGAVLSLYDSCPAAEGETVPPQVAAQVHVLRFWDSRPVPPLEPSIQPGWAITGLRAFLETGPQSVPETTLLFDTPLGRAELIIDADYEVDWGDGSPVESYSTPGGPYPDGPISHVYQYAEPVTVRVSQNWGGQWRMTSGVAAGAGGELPSLAVTAAVDLDVREVQAVVQ